MSIIDVGLYDAGDNRLQLTNSEQRAWNWQTESERCGTGRLWLFDKSSPVMTMNTAYCQNWGHQDCALYQARTILNLADSVFEKAIYYGITAGNPRDRARLRKRRQRKGANMLAVEITLPGVWLGVHVFATADVTGDMVGMEREEALKVLRDVLVRPGIRRVDWLGGWRRRKRTTSTAYGVFVGSSGAWRRFCDEVEARTGKRPPEEPSRSTYLPEDLTPEEYQQIAERVRRRPALGDT